MALSSDEVRMGASAAALMVANGIHTTVQHRGTVSSHSQSTRKWLGLGDGKTLCVVPIYFAHSFSLTKTNGRRATMLRHVLNAGGRAAVSANRPQRYVPLGGDDIMAASDGRRDERVPVE